MHPLAQAIYEKSLDKFRVLGREQRKSASLKLFRASYHASCDDSDDIAELLALGGEALLVVHGLLKLEEEKITAER